MMATTINELLPECQHYELSKQLCMGFERYPGLVPSCRRERKNKELKKTLLIPVSPQICS